jgi:hypothetical protein
MSTHHDHGQDALAAAAHRAPYATPALRVFGTLAALTRNTLCSPNKVDGAKGCGGSFKGKS